MSDLPESLRKALRAGTRAVRLAAREPRAAFLLVRMAWWVAALTFLLKAGPLPRALKFLTPRARPASPFEDPEKIQAETARLLDLLLAADFWVFTPTCWKRAPVLHRFLALRGIPTRVVFGVRKEDRAALGGHAWLEAEGKPLLEPDAPNYTVTYSHPS